MNKIKKTQQIEQYKLRMIAIKESDDCELAHEEADDLLCEILESLGYKEVVKAYDDIEKWYA